MQLHDFNPGIEANGLFWTDEIDPGSVAVHPGKGSAVMDVRDLPSRDYHDLVNAITGGPFLAGVVSFRVEWTSSSDRHHFHDPGTVPGTAFDANVVLNSAQAWWRGETSEALYVADDISTSASLFAEVGHERNGVYFPDS
jgi:hypothetical protein